MTPERAKLSSLHTWHERTSHRGGQAKTLDWDNPSANCSKWNKQRNGLGQEEEAVGRAGTSHPTAPLHFCLPSTPPVLQHIPHVDGQTFCATIHLRMLAAENTRAPLGGRDAKDPPPYSTLYPLTTPQGRAPFCHACPSPPSLLPPPAMVHMARNYRQGDRGGAGKLGGRVGRSSCGKGMGLLV